MFNLTKQINSFFCERRTCCIYTIFCTTTAFNNFASWSVKFSSLNSLLGKVVMRTNGLLAESGWELTMKERTLETLNKLNSYLTSHCDWKLTSSPVWFVKLLSKSLSRWQTNLDCRGGFRFIYDDRWIDRRRHRGCRIRKLGRWTKTETWFTTKTILFYIVAFPTITKF